MKNANVQQKKVTNIVIRTDYDNPNGYYWQNKNGTTVHIGTIPASHLVQQVQILANPELSLTKVKDLLEEALEGIEETIEFFRRENIQLKY